LCADAKPKKVKRPYKPDDYDSDYLRDDRFDPSPVKHDQSSHSRRRQNPSPSSDRAGRQEKHVEKIQDHPASGDRRVVEEKLEMYELEMRARAIKSMMRTSEDN